MVSCIFTENKLEFGHFVIKPRLVECHSDVCPYVSFSHLHIRLCSSTRVTISVFLTSLAKTIFLQLLSLARRLDLERVLIVSNFIHKVSWRPNSPVNLQHSIFFL